MENVLKGTKILRFEKVLDYWQIITESAIVSIYNPGYFVIDDEKKTFDEGLLKNVLPSNIVDEIYVCGERYQIILENNISIVVSLRECDYVSPEAIVVGLEDNHIIVIE